MKTNENLTKLRRGMNQFSIFMDIKIIFINLINWNINDQLNK